jgi:hypothetical protein
MKKDTMWLGGLVLAVALSLGALAIPAVAGDLPPAEKVLAKYTEAIGGEALAKVKNMTAELEFEMPMQGVYAAAEEFRVFPGRFFFRIDLASMGVVDFEAGVVDGLAWQSHPMAGTSELSGDERAAALRRAALNPFEGWQEQFETAETVAEEVVAEKACYKVVLTPAEGAPLSSFFDRETGLLVRQVVGGDTGPRVVTTLGDYQETQGILSPRTIEIDGPESYTLEYTSVVYDVEDIPEDTFELPASLQAAGQ